MNRHLVAALALISALQAVPDTKVFANFESDGYGEWQHEGEAFGIAPVSSHPKGLGGKPEGHKGSYWVTSGHGGDASTGSLTSPEFTITEPSLSFLIAGGNHPGKTAVQLLVEGKVVLEATGQNSLKMRPVTWDLSKFQGKKARLRGLDTETDRWGIINFDHFVFGPAVKPQDTAEIDTQKLVPTDAIPGATIPAGSQLQVFATHEDHHVTSPTALSIDEQGRVFIAETHRFRFGIEDNRNHLYWLEDDLSSQTTEDRRKLHEKWDHKTPIESLTEKSEKIRVVVDENGDGLADKSVLFADGFDDLLDGTAAGIMALDGTIYFACIPHLWTLQDTDGDLKANTRTSLQDGFGVHISLSGHDFNGFALGPDGRIYATVGDRSFNLTTKEGKHFNFPGQGAILRFEPDGSNLEIVHHGLRNPKEIAFDQWGNGITVDNNSDQGDEARVVFMMEGADSGWRIEHQVLFSFHRTAGLQKRPINRWMEEKIWETQNDLQPGSIVPPIDYLANGPSGLAYHPGTGFNLGGSKDRFLITDYKGSPAASGIWKFGIEPAGAGFKMIDAKKFNWGVAVTDLEWGYDGKIYVTDFITGWRSAEQGRIYTLSQPEMAEDPLVAEVTEIIKNDIRTLPSTRLAELLSHPDQRLRNRAHIELTKRPEGRDLLTTATQHEDLLTQLHGTWGLGILARLNEDSAATETLTALLSSPSEKIRAQAATALGEAPLQDPAILLPLFKDQNLTVRAHAALALARHGTPEFIDPAIALLTENNNQDPWLRHAGTMTLLASASPDQLLSLTSHQSQPARLAAVVALDRLRDPRLTAFLDDPDLAVAQEAIRAIHDTYLEEARPAVAALLDLEPSKIAELAPTDMLLRRLTHSAFRLGGQENITRLTTFAAEPTFSDQERLEALRLLSLWTNPPFFDQSTGVAKPLPPRNPEPFKNTLATAIKPLLDSQGEILEKTLDLVIEYELTLDGLDPSTLEKYVLNPDLPGETRAVALRLFAEENHENLSDLLATATQDKDDSLAAVALALAAEMKPAEFGPTLQTALDSDRTALRQKAFTLLGTLPAEQALPPLLANLEKLTAGQADPASALELLTAAEARSEPAVKSALAAYQKSLPADDPLAPYAVTLEGGDPGRGFEIFKAHPSQCARCHQAEGGLTEGGGVGPSLAGVATRLSPQQLLESMILPNAEISPGFGTIVVTFNNNATKAGLLYEETEDHLTLVEGENVWKIKKSDLKSQSQPVSGMPPMEALLQKDEMRDLIAWLLTLDKKSATKSAPPKPELLDPATLIKDPTPKPEPATDMPANETTQTEPSPPAEPVTSETKTTEATETNEDTLTETTEDTQATDGQDSVLALGKELYNIPGSCVTCHQATGLGLPPAFPPLADSEWVSGPAENLIRIQLRGVQGEIKVGDIVYNAAMPPLTDAVFPQTDENLAAVLTYVRHTFGNGASPITPEMVAEYAHERDQPTMLTVADLLDPLAAPAGEGPSAAEIQLVGTPPTNLPSSGLGLPGFAIFLIVVITALAAIGAIRMNLTK